MGGEIRIRLKISVLFKGGGVLTPPYTHKDACLNLISNAPAILFRNMFKH